MVHAVSAHRHESTHSHEEPDRGTFEGLRCEECGREADDRARGWRALHGKELDEDYMETFVYCPWCAERFFGPQLSRR